MKKIEKTILIIFLVSINYLTFGQIKTLKGDVLTISEIDKFIENKMDSLHIPGLSIAIIEDKKIVYYRATGLKNLETKDSVDSNTLFEACSITKPVFAYTVIKLAQKQIINLDTPLYRYYPFEDIDHDERYKLISARMVLSHTSGFPNWRDCGGCELSINATPGTKYIYSGEGYEYLATVIKHLTGKPLQDVVQEEVFTPLNIQNAYFVENEYLKDHMATGHTDTKVGSRIMTMRAHMAYGLRIEAKEYAKFAIALMHECNMLNSTFSIMSIPQIEIEPQKSMCLGILMEQTTNGIKYRHSGENGNQFHCNFEFFKDQQIGYVFFMNCNKKPEFTKALNSFLYKSF